MALLDRIKKALAPELYVEQGALFQGVPRPSYVLAGMIAQRILHPDTEIRQETASSYSAREPGKFHIIWGVRKDDEYARLRRFYAYYNRKDGNSNGYWNGNDHKNFLSVKMAYRAWLTTNPLLGETCHILNIKEPDVPFLMEDRLLIQESLRDAVKLYQARKKGEKEHEQQQKAVAAIEAWMGVKPETDPHGEQQEEE